MCFFEFSVCIMFLYVFFVCFRLVFLSCCIYNRKTPITTFKKKHDTNRKLEETHKQTQTYRISSPRTSANILCDLFAEVRGLDILYFLFFSFFLFLCFSLSFLFKFVFLFLFLYVFVCFRLVFLSFCIYNQTTHIQTSTNNRTTLRQT